MLKAWGVTALAILGAIAAIVAVSTAWGFYPIGVIVLLAVAVAAALWVIRTQHRAASAVVDPGAKQHDARVVAEVRGIVTRGNIDWLRTSDFGGSFRAQWVEPFHALGYLDDVEHRPLDPELGHAFRALQDATHEFTDLLNQHAFRERGDGDDRWYNVGWSGGEAEGLRGPQRRVWEERRDLLNAGFDPVASTYDEFVDVARRKLVLHEEAPDPAVE